MLSIDCSIRTFDVLEQPAMVSPNTYPFAIYMCVWFFLLEAESAGVGYAEVWIVMESEEEK